MRNLTGFALGTSAMFLAVMAVLIDTPPLFYMSTAMIVMVAASRLQAWLAVRGLKFERIYPETVTVGDLVTVEIEVMSERKIKRPLVMILDNLPKRLVSSQRSPSLPIAPAYDQPIRTQYRFRPMRKGVFRWKGLTVIGSDALALVTMQKQYDTPIAEMMVLPVPIPVSVELPIAGGWGAEHSETGRQRGSGIEPRGIREYTQGDSLRHVHWRSSARRGQLLVKEFDSSNQAIATFVFQRRTGTDVGTGLYSTLDTICGHTLFLAEKFIKQGATLEFPQLAPGEFYTAQERRYQIAPLLARLEANQPEDLGQELSAHTASHPGSVVYAFLSVQDPSLPDAIRELTALGTHVAALIYDLDHFHTPTRRKPTSSAAEPQYVEALREAGAYVKVMPLEHLQA